MKAFQGEGYADFLAQVEDRFDAVKGVKPSASARKSAEIYILAVGRDGDVPDG